MSVHLIRYRGRSAPGGTARWLLDYPALHRVAGLRLGYLTATSFGPPTHPEHYPVPNPRRACLFAVWEEEAALDAFLADSAIAHRWRRHADEMLHVRLQACRWHGTWGGNDPLSGVSPSPPPKGPGATLTFVSLHPRGFGPFYNSLRGVHADLGSRPDLLTYAGVSDVRRPWFRVGTFALWRSIDDALSFAYGPAPHVQAKTRSVEEGWFRESFFARLRPYASEGTWGGSNPLDSLLGETSATSDEAEAGPKHDQ